MQKNSDTTDFDPMSRGVAQSGVRITNERAVLTLLAINPGASNADVARLSGLGPQTTSRIVAELESRALVIRGDVLRGRRGQPATPLFLNPHGAVCIGIELGWRHFEVVVIELSGNTLASVRRSYAYPDARTIFSDIAAEVATIRSGLTEIQRARLAGIGVASPSHIGRNIALVDPPEDQAALWQEIDLVQRIGQEVDLPVHWYNDGNAACWAEIVNQPDPRPRNLAYFQVGTFIGGGLIAHGELWEGNGHAANFGSMLICDDSGQPNYVHLVASIMALERLLVAAGREAPLGSPYNWDWAALEPVATSWIEESAKMLAKAIVNVRAVIEVDKVIIDGVMPRDVVQRMHERVRYHLEALPTLTADHPAVELGTRGASAAAIGAAQLVLFQRYFSRAWNLFST